MQNCGSHLRQCAPSARLRRAELALRKGNIALDEGEDALWSHALGRSGPWVLCGPDRASLRCGVRLGYRERLVSLEELLDHVGYRPTAELRRPYTKRWQDEVVRLMYLEEWFGTGRAEGLGILRAHIIEDRIAITITRTTSEPVVMMAKTEGVVLTRVTDGEASIDPAGDRPGMDAVLGAGRTIVPPKPAAAIRPRRFR